MAKKKTKAKAKPKKVEKTCEVNMSCCGSKSNMSCSAGDAIYCLGIIGAAVYYITTATGFWNGVWGLIKAFLWPAFVVFEVLKYLGM